MNNKSLHDLTEDEQRKVSAQVEYFLHLISQRYDVSPAEVVETVKWVRDRKQMAERVRSTGLVSLIGLVISALSLVAWEGLKSLLSQGR